MAKVLFKRKTTNEIKNLEVEDGALIYNTDNGKTYMDFGENRIQTGGNADTMITIGGEEAPTDTDIKIWIKDKDNQNYNNFYYRKNDNKFEQMFLQPTGDTLPVGSIAQFGGKTAPTNWLFCNGQAVSRTDYPDLFKAIGTTYGSGDGSTTFNVPDFIGRVPVGLDKEDTDFDTLGETGGEKKHTLTVNEMPEHHHAGIKYSNYNQWLTSETGSNGNTIGLKFNTGGNPLNSVKSNENLQYSTDQRGGSQAHNNMQPYTVTNFIIKAKQSVGVVGTVTSNINDTNDNAVPSAKTVKDYVKEIYSTNEVKTNKVWIDGKPIYRKVINSTCPSKSATWATISSNLNADEILSYTGYIEFSTSEHKLLAVGTSQFTYFQLNKTSHELQIATNDSGFFGKPIKVIIEYTKIID